MRNLTLTLAIITLSSSLHAQADIASARAMVIGSTVTITGIVTNGAEFGDVRYVQDATAGIACFPGTGSVPLFDPLRGDEITLTGQLKDYNGLLEVDPITSYTVNSSGNTLPIPQLITPMQIGEANEGSLMEVANATFVNGGATFTSTTWDFTSGGEAGVIFLRSGHPLIGSIVPSGPLDIVGISSQFSFTGSGGYQLLPRDANDITLLSSINFTTPVTQTNISTTGFDLNWNTDDLGSTYVNYGTTPALGTVIGNATGTTMHDLPLTGLTAATIYYAQAYSVLGSDTAFSTIGVYATASNSSGIMRVYFNRSVDNSVSTGVNASALGGFTNDTIKAYIDKAQVSLDVAVYNASDATIMNAINDAYNRGVQVRYVYEAGNVNSGLSILNPAIPTLGRQNATGSGMHNKFMVIDADDTDNSWILGGSTNWTTNNLFDDYNNLVFIQDESLAKAYRLEFEEMWGSNGAMPNVSNSRFGPDKLNDTPHEFIIGGKKVEAYFSPSDGTTASIVRNLNTVNAKIHFALLVLTNNDLRDALINADGTFGISVDGLIEQENVTGSDFADLVTAGVGVLSHQGLPDDLHHKYAIVDTENPASDPLVITGSHNWSGSAETENDENTLIIHDATIANLYYQEYVARRAQASVGVEEFGVAGIDMVLYPNPANNMLNVQFTAIDGGVVSLNVFDATGRNVSNSQTTSIPGSNNAMVNVNALSDGVYVLQMTTGEQRGQRMFVVRR